MRPEKIDVVPAGIEPDLFNNHRSVDKFRNAYNPDGHPIVMYAGVLNGFQRIEYLLHAFTIVLREQQEARLFIVSPLRSKTHEKSTKHLLHNLA